MKRFVSGESRDQSTLFPETIDDYIGGDNPVRAVDVFVDELDLGDLGFNRVDPAVTGRPAYHPSTLLKIYIYGYLNRVQSSRRLERETQRNLELIWLTGRLSPDFKTIADFRKDNGPAIQKVCSEFVMLCRQLNLLSTGAIAIDGSKFKAVNNRDKNLTKHKLKSRMEHLEKSVARYLDELDRVDKEPDEDTPERVSNLKHKVATIRSHMKKLQATGKQLDQVPDHQISETDPDARSMVSQGRGTGMVGYNVQTAVDSENHLIVAHEVTNSANDRNQLSAMSEKAAEATGREDFEVLADRGYYSSEEILACEGQGMTPMVPKPLTAPGSTTGRYDRRDFKYIDEDDEYECPAGERATYRFSSDEKGLLMHSYWSSACVNCPVRDKCTTSDYRRIKRWDHAEILERMEDRMAKSPDASRIRRQTVEHPYATIKMWMGSTHFLMKTLPNVSTEMSLHVLAYNMTRLLNIFGTERLIQAMRG